MPLLGKEMTEFPDRALESRRLHGLLETRSALRCVPLDRASKWKPSRRVDN